METDEPTNPPAAAAADLQSMDDDTDNNDAAAFVNLNDVVEVQVDDTDVPMDEDDIEEEGGTTNNDATTTAQQQVAVVDMAKVVLESHSDSIYAVACHYDASSTLLHVLSGAGDDRAILYKINSSGKEIIPLEYAHKDSVSCVALNLQYATNEGDVPYAAVGAYDGAIVVYDPNSGKKLQELEGPSDVEFVAFHPKGGSVLLAGSVQDGTVWMYHLPSSKCLQVFVGHERGVTAGAFTPDGKLALSASEDGTLRVWAPKTGFCKHTFRCGVDSAGLTCLATNGGVDGKLVMVGAEDGMAYILHYGTKKEVKALRHYEVPPSMQQQDDAAGEDEELALPMSVEAVGFASSSVNPHWCATGGVDGKLKIWDMNTGQCRQTCHQPNNEGASTSNNTSSGGGGVTRLQWHPHLPLVYTATSDGTVRVWDARNGSLVTTLTGHTDMVNAMDCVFSSKDGGNTVVVTGSDDKSVRVFEVNDNP